MLSRLGAAALSPAVDLYIRRQRNRLAHRAKPLGVLEKHELGEYFRSEVLECARVIIADPLPIPDPPFTNIVRKLGFDFPSPSLTEAITFDHVIAARDRLGISLLFHELVHVVQFRILGIRVFAHEYVRGFLNGGNYHRIPLERCAFELQFRFDTTAAPFDAEAAIRSYLQAG